MYAHVHPLSDMHHYQRPKAFVYVAKVTVGNALKTPEAHHWVEALNSEIKQLLDTGTLRAFKLFDVPIGASVINSTMALRKKPDKYKARLCACGNELKGQIAEIYLPTIGALTYFVVHQIAIIDRMHVRIIDGLPDSGRAYYQAYSTLLVNSGYITSKSDPCLFLKFYPNSDDRIYIWVHVDNTFTAATSIELLDEIERVVSN